MTGSSVEEDLWVAVEPSRRKIVDLLLAESALTPSALASELSITRQAVSKHLRVLARVGLVESSRRGREVHFTLRTSKVDALVKEMDRSARSWDRRLATIKSLAERAHRATP